MNNTPFSAHKDVLDAPVPDVEAGRARLLDEVKNRGRMAVQAGDWLNANALYDKALTCCGDSDADKKQKAILHANRALVLGKMGRWSESSQAAQTATELDASYTKGWWRLGQALSQQSKYEEAASSMQKALDLEPNNKALKKEFAALEAKAKEAAAAAEKAKAEAAAAAAQGDSAKDTTTTTTTTTVVEDSSKPSSAAKKTSNSSGSEPMQVDNDEEFTKSEHVKGYKIVNGKKTSYFHNELSQEAAALIGDIAPKKLDAGSSGAASTASPQRLDDNKGGTSAWNKAGTWEERDATKWALDSLKERLDKVAYTLPASSPAPGATVQTRKATVTGHASVATVRGKTRYIYELLVKLEWEFDHEEVSAHGTLNFPDVDGTCELGEGYDATDFLVQHSDASNLRPVLDQFVHKQGWRTACHDCIDDWVRLFKETY